MNKIRYIAAGGTFLLAFGLMLNGDGAKITGLITGKAAFSDAKDIKVGSFRKITVADLPDPGGDSLRHEPEDDSSTCGRAAPGGGRVQS